MTYDLSIPGFSHAEVERVEKLFHKALEDDGNAVSHGIDSDWVDGSAIGVVQALLAAGWKPPADPENPGVEVEEQ